MCERQTNLVISYTTSSQWHCQRHHYIQKYEINCTVSCNRDCLLETEQIIERKTAICS